ncbi:hypothetical protein TNCV_1782691 [Trichonephila clavipes]|nr:hypothetical protein TNCV_1782691 [Trichonephila clavipes]
MWRKLRIRQTKERSPMENKLEQTKEKDPTLKKVLEGRMTFDSVDGVRTVKSLGSKDMDAKCRKWQQPDQTKRFNITARNR